MSAMSILAEREAFLPAIFPSFNEGSQSLFSVWLNDTGIWRSIVIDDFFPYDRDSETWAIATTKETFETWPMVLEKGLAKLYGSFEALECGHPVHFMHDMTGAPYDYFYFDDA
mmetsp:Transcript_10107/g.8626  ORF Transcript_10107/g.8626 Transcript_10107/m.8626 type:complete len:113 (+) Transcript_10107:1456-1794(+)